MHKALKYGIWTSSRFNNIKFNQNFKNTNGEVYFIFTCLTTDYFIGMAKMVYPNELDMEFAYWGEIGKWRGLMMVQWVYLADVGFNMITDIEQEGEMLFNMKDGAELTLNNAQKMIKLFDERKTQTSSVFKEFFKYDMREIKVRSKIDSLIQTGMYEMAKKEVDKKKRDYAEEKQEEKAEQVDIQIMTKKKKQKKKKLTKKQLKELKEQDNS